jgi:uncharacterized Ntn-hydrolase superfamily protein
MPTRTRFGTFSVVAADLERQEFGVAVQSKFIAVGAVVPWAEAGAGAVATQALANASYGPRGLELLRGGLGAEEVIRRLTGADPEREHRQLGVVDRKGGAASYTGSKCMEWAGHVVGDGFACQGNILLSSEVVEAMARAMEHTPGDLPERLLAALAAGQRMGGDRRGMQSAALLVVRPGGSYGGTLDRWIDVRVDDHPSPIEELQRVFRLYDLTLLTREDPATLLPLDRERVASLQTDLRSLGFYFGPSNGRWDPATQEAFRKFLGVNNFEEKERTDGTIWPSVMSYLEEAAREAERKASRAAGPVYGALESGPGRSSAPGPSSGAPPARRKGRSP